MKMLIDSQWADSADRRTKAVRNPGTGETIDEVPLATEGDIDRALKAATEGSARMRAMPAHERSAVLTRAAAAIQGRREELSTLLARENGKPIRQTRAEVEVAGRLFSGFAEEGRRIFGRTIPMDAVPGNERHFAMTIRQPIGVVAAIVPFNYPVELYAHKAAAALAAGNSVIVKPPSACPLTLLKIAEILEEAGLPRAAHQMITGPGEMVGEHLALSPVVRLVSLTGSVAVGIRLTELGARNLQKVHLELGGNDATIVCADADLDKATDAIVLGRLARGNGQICCAVKRVFIDARVYAEFSSMLASKAALLKVGDQLAEDTDCGPLISESAAKKVEASIAEAVEAGAKLLYGGTRRGAFIVPTVLGDVPTSAPLFMEETFGPVAPLVSFSDEEEAIRMANDSPFGLQAAVFTKDISRAMTIASRLEAGGVIINWSSALRAENVPFGGIKMSGHGREALHDTLIDMTEQKAIVIHNAFPEAPSPERTDA
ncbi:MAG: aldehyde dehydrogenase family protein [Rectinemataceae bacterium]|jgi:lactaldehyde dehydrogenase